MKKIDEYWQSYCDREGLNNANYKEAFQFGEKADWLASLVVDGIKTATCSSYPLYAVDGDPLPEVGDYQIVLNSNNEPVAIIQSYAIEVHTFKDVPIDFALAEGAGTYEQWKDAHIAFFTKLLTDYNLKFTPEMLVVCDRFKKVYPK